MPSQTNTLLLACSQILPEQQVASFVAIFPGAGSSVSEKFRPLFLACSLASRGTIIHGNEALVFFRRGCVYAAVGAGHCTAVSQVYQMQHLFVSLCPEGRMATLTNPAFFFFFALYMFIHAISSAAWYLSFKCTRSKQVLHDPRGARINGAHTRTQKGFRP